MPARKLMVCVSDRMADEEQNSLEYRLQVVVYGEQLCVAIAEILSKELEPQGLTVQGVLHA